MTRLLTIFAAVLCMSVAYAGNSYADSDSDDKSEYKYEKKHDKSHDDGRKHKDDNRRDYRDGSNSMRSNDPVNQNIDRAINHVSKIERKMDQAREWWQFW